ncbi:MAG: hypothetical protein EA384_15070 [Spirochaetaceae bacterium]|nr:MAG: hypothetical protein EA384_15070 [Spirochaetaceae bacterium]
MSAAAGTRSVTVPAAAFSEFLAASGLGTRLTLALQRYRPEGRTLEQQWDLNLEIELLADTVLPDRLQLQLLELLDPLEGVMAVRVRGSVCGAELLPAETRAATLAAIRGAWARALWWRYSAEFSDGPQSPWAWLQSALPAVESVEAVEVVEQGALSVEERETLGSIREPLPGGGCVAVDTDSFEVVLRRAEHYLTDGGNRGRRAIREEIEAAAADAAVVRYLCCRLYNRHTAPADPFALRELLTEPPETTVTPVTPVTPAERVFLVPMEAADAEPLTEQLLRLGRRSIELEQQLIDMAAGLSDEENDQHSNDRIGKSQHQPDNGRADEAADGGSDERGGGTDWSAAAEPAVSAQQLIGTPGAPGRVRGVVSRSSALSAPASGGGRAVIVCDRLTARLLQQKGGAVAVIERLGGAVGLGALLARREGLACVSGVADLSLLREGSNVCVDGDLGLVTIERAPDAH